MGLNLTIDRGNSAVKAALYDGRDLVALCTEESLSAALDALLSDGREHVDAAIYCSVTADADDDMALLAQLVPGVLRLTPQTPVPLVIEYEHRESLGVDRIAAAVGAATSLPGRSLLVVDAGTAVTYDVVSSDGRFVGGNIAPGVKMRLEALHHFTARLPLIDVPGKLECGSVFGDSTRSAMLKGAVMGLVAEIDFYRRQLPLDTQVVMTGGSAPLLSALMTTETTVDSHLVTNGLNCILKYNEDK